MTPRTHTKMIIDQMFDNAENVFEKLHFMKIAFQRLSDGMKFNDFSALCQNVENEYDSLRLSGNNGKRIGQELWSFYSPLDKLCMDLKTDDSNFLYGYVLGRLEEKKLRE